MHTLRKILASTLERLPLLLLTVCVMASPGMLTTAQAGDETGIEGAVLWGPVKPGPSTVGEEGEAPLRASFDVYSGETKVVSFESDRNGRFRVALPPGDYTIVPASGTPVPRPETQVTRVTVPAKGFASVTIQLATGML